MTEMDTEVTEVVFRKFKDNGDIIALFPYVREYNYHVLSYMHIGQHGASDYYPDGTIPAKPEEYQSLFDELTSLGYNLKVIKRANHRRMYK